MRATSTSSALVGIASCVASFLAGIAYADGFVPAASRSAATAFTETADLECIPISPDGERPETVILPPSFEDAR